MKKKSLGHEGRIASLKRARSVTIEHTADTLDIMQTDASNSYDNNGDDEEEGAEDAPRTVYEGQWLNNLRDGAGT